METVQKLIDKLATYSFECEGGPLHNCVDYHKLCVYALMAERAEAERDALVDWNRVLNEEMVNAGMQGGDRTTTLGNVRRLIAERDALRADAQRYRKALLDSIKYIAMNKAEEELCILLNMAHAAGITEADTDAAEDAARAALAQEKS